MSSKIWAIHQDLNVLQPRHSEGKKDVHQIFLYAPILLFEEFLEMQFVTWDIGNSRENAVLKVICSFMSHSLSSDSNSPLTQT